VNKRRKRTTYSRAQHWHCIEAEFPSIKYWNFLNALTRGYGWNTFHKIVSYTIEEFKSEEDKIRMRCLLEGFCEKWEDCNG
jgi:hypothetical protein